ncbi:MAG: hypothetical protein V7L05_17605 [Nostoc sp.]|uniref:hypothetical protein n=1 Tax=Nostoc sp. TaxID=1180 RepID=UPI002FF80639
MFQKCLTQHSWLDRVLESTCFIYAGSQGGQDAIAVKLRRNHFGQLVIMLKTSHTTKYEINFCTGF